MDPIDVREERVAAGQTAPPAPYAPGTAVPATSVAARRTTVVPVGYRVNQLVWLILVVVNLILALDFVFRAAGANHSSGFVHYVYRIGGWLAAPFEGIFGNGTANHGTSVLRWADVLAIVIYTVAAWIVTRLVRIVSTPRSAAPAI